jgi:2-dehydropantoate 2-reductase
LPHVIGSPDWLFRNLFMKAWKIDEKARSSMADDLAAGRKTEVDYINGELVRLAERLGTNAPVNRKVVELVRKAEGGAPPWPPLALRREGVRPLGASPRPIWSWHKATGSTR